MSHTWSEPVDDGTAQRRAGGRRAHNAHRKLLALIRRHRLSELFTYNHGDVGRAAAALGVSRWTIWRDMKAMGMDVHGAWRLLNERHLEQLRPRRRRGRRHR